MSSLKGRLLVASPSLLDGNFFRTVILMLEDGAEGSVGVVVNRPTEATITRLSEQAFGEELEWDKPIHLGGPVPGPLIAIHTTESCSDQELAPGLYSTADPVKLQILVRQQTEPSILVANCAGWGPGQLASEMEGDSWRTLPARPELVFAPDASLVWPTVIKEISRTQLQKLLRLRGSPADPSMN